MAAPGGAPIASWQTMDESSDTLDAEDAPAPDDRREEREESSRQRVAQAIAIVAVVLASVPALPLAVRHHPALIAPFMLVPLGLLVGAAYSGSSAALRLIIGTDCILLAVLAFGIWIWPVPLALAPLVVWVTSMRFCALRPALAWLRMGKLTRNVQYLMLGTVAVSAGALTAWAFVVHPSVGPLLGALQKRPLPVVVIGIIGFALLNAACEEAGYRGFFFSELRNIAGFRVALVVQTVAFGLIHVSGFPSGPAGVVLAGVYGFMLGVIRQRSDGMAASYITHVFADMTIGLLAVIVL